MTVNVMRLIVKDIDIIQSCQKNTQLYHIRGGGMGVEYNNNKS